MTWTEIGDNFKNFFSAEYWKNGWVFLVLQLLLLAVIFYYVFKILWNNRAKKLIVILTVVLLVAGVAFLYVGFEPGIMLFAVILIVLLICTMFNTEIKRTLLKSHKMTSVDKTKAKRAVDEIVKAVMDMSKKRTGALIILADKNLPAGVKESGTEIDGEISADLLEALFFHNSPLHDGSVVIEKNKIQAAGCFVQMRSYDNIAPSYMGARHRAALSIAAQAPVTVIVVSEENGRISIMDNDLPDPPTPGMQLVNGRGDKITPTSVLPNGQKFIETATEVDIREVLRRYFWDYNLGEEEEKLR